MRNQVIIVGAGIVGLSMARSLAIRGYKVTVIERNHIALGASIRNFGMIWPVGQPEGEMYAVARHSRDIWKELCVDASIWHDEVGSLHTAYDTDELIVLEELVENFSKERNCQLLTPKQTLQKSEAVEPHKLMGSFWSPDEMIVNPRQAVRVIPIWLHERFGVEFIWGKVITAIDYPTVFSGKQSWKADLIFICSGIDFETLYPEQFEMQPITKCKLQMIKLASQPSEWRIGPALCGALSLIHYKSFESAPSLSKLRERFKNNYSDYIKWGIHVMVSQNQEGELTVGDSHEYGPSHDPFENESVNQLILDYLKSFTRLKDNTIIERWHGVYPKMTNGESFLQLQIQNGVTIVNGLGGAGMTLSLGISDRIVEKL